MSVYTGVTEVMAQLGLRNPDDRERLTQMMASGLLARPIRLPGGKVGWLKQDVAETIAKLRAVS